MLFVIDKRVNNHLTIHCPSRKEVVAIRSFKHLYYNYYHFFNGGLYGGLGLMGGLYGLGLMGGLYGLGLYGSLGLMGGLYGLGLYGGLGGLGMYGNLTATQIIQSLLSPTTTTTTTAPATPVAVT